MKTPKQLLLSIAIGVLSLTTVACGSSGGSSGGSTAATPIANPYCTGTQTYGVSCGTNMIQSQYGCLPQCGMNAVSYNGQCLPIQNTNTAAYGCSANGYGGYGTGYGTGYGAGYGTGYGNLAMCQGTCPAGLVSFNGGTACMPQGSCSPCYAQMGGYCYIGDYAHQYYGY